MFGNNLEIALNEDSSFFPKSSYAEAKLLNHLKVLELATSYDWNIKSGIMFNHESNLENVIFTKVIQTVKNQKRRTK